MTGSASHPISLLSSLNGSWLKLPDRAMADVGPATQSLAGLLKITRTETFVPVETIAENALLPISTVRKHIKILDHHGWIENRGRERTRSGRPRRTCTIRLTEKSISTEQRYGFLPCWACCEIEGVGTLSWASKAVLSIVMARLCSIKKVANRAFPTSVDYGYDEDDLIGSIENLNFRERFRFSLTQLAELTGLNRESIILAKRWLDAHGVICLTGGDGSTGADCLNPNYRFRVIETRKQGSRTFSFSVDWSGRILGRAESDFGQNQTPESGN